MRYRHLAIQVPDLHRAEAFYRELFELEVMFREAPTSADDDAWAQLRSGVGWAEAEAAGVDIGMVALGRGDVVLAYEPG
jgi:catechol 2,3-dioxygenase-like lactoylglutathione lyase family enzyme